LPFFGVSPLDAHLLLAPLLVGDRRARADASPTTRTCRRPRLSPGWARLSVQRPCTSR